MVGPITGWRGENGSALACALMVIALIATLGGAVVLIVNADGMISVNYRSAQHAMYAADAGVERAIGALRGVADWRTVVGAVGATADFDDGDEDARVRLADGTILDLARLTALRQANTDASFGAFANRPRWRLFVHAPFDRMLPRGSGVNPEYIAVWLADDPDESDGDPMHDSNDQLVLHAEAYGLRGGWWRIDVLIGRECVGNETDPAGAASGAIRVLSWRESQ